MSMSTIPFGAVMLVFGCHFLVTKYHFLAFLPCSSSLLGGTVMVEILLSILIGCQLKSQDSLKMRVVVLVGIPCSGKGKPGD